MVLSLILLILILIVLSYGVYNLMRRNEVLEDLVNDQATKLSDIRTTVLNVESKLVSLDIKGSFESDDEVGFFFTEIRKLSSELKETVQDNYDI